MNPITARRPDPDVPYVRVSIDPLTLLPALLLTDAEALALAEELGVAAYIRQGHEKPVGDVRELREHVAVGL
ncbi:MAG: hypothetical protein IPL80_19840 [Sterolibacteriaceae bacterium]|nr:hypothetical protein [Sterolibacteriaceae bacterium]